MVFLARPPPAGRGTTKRTECASQSREGGGSQSQAARSGIDAEPRLADKNGGLGIVLPPEAPVLIPVGVPLSSFQLFKQFQSQCATVLDDAAHLFDTLHMHLQLLRHDVEAHEAAIKRVMNWLATDC